MVRRSSSPLRVVTAVAPIRICDIGGWTDTWFARHGHVVNIAVSPLVSVRLEVHARQDDVPAVTIIVPGPPGEPASGPATPGTHPLLEAAIASMSRPDDVSIVVEVRSVVPPGAGTGTSAAVTVALIAALDLLTPGRLTAEGIARAAHEVEVTGLGQQCGVQDQLASALGGINAIAITDYPRTHATRIDLPDGLASELERRLSLVYLGRGHDSSGLHERVIQRLAGAGPDCPELDDLRRCAIDATEALRGGDLARVGRAMIDNTEAQARLHPDLVSRDARAVIDIARAHGALGWKVNGAGGEGGSVTLLASAAPATDLVMREALAAANPLFREIPIRLSATGVSRWEAPPSPPTS